MNKKKRIFTRIVTFFICFVVLFTTLASIVRAEGVVPENHVIDRIGIMDQLNKDKVGLIANELSDKNVEFIYTIESSIKNSDPNKQAKDTYYEWVGKNEGKKVVVAVYYMDDNQIEIFQENNNLISNNTTKKIVKNLEQYRKNNNVNKGMLYSYSVMANEIANKIEVKLNNTKDVTFEYRTTIMQSMPLVLIGCIAVVLGLGLRKKKKK